MNPQLGLFPRSPSQRVPALTEAMRLALEAVELAGGVRCVSGGLAGLGVVRRMRLMRGY